MVSAANSLLARARFDSVANIDQRASAFAASGAPLDLYGIYGEMGLRAIADVLLLPSVRERTGPTRRFVDFGSGSGRLILGVAAMAEWEACTGIEAVTGLHAIACECIDSAEANEAIPPGLVTSVLADGLPHVDSPAVMAAADVCFMYSTAFPTADDGLRLPEMSASLATVMKEGSLVVTTDTLLVGRRFAFDTLKPVKGEDGDRLNCFVWRVTGAPAPSYNDAYAEVQAHWLGDDALAENDALCEALEAAAFAEVEELQ